ncbi:MAG: hypothetical protein VZS44_06895 [Bacilli bacterium]|nr:hypothetical protein [Bacilli bacterium]
MDSIRIVVEAIASFFFILNIYLLFADRQFKLINVVLKYTKIYTIISFIFSLIGLIIGINVYSELDLLMSLVCFFSFIPLIVSIIGIIRHKEVKNLDIIYNSNNFRELTKDEKMKYKKLLVLDDNKMMKINGNERLLVCECSLNKVDDGDILKIDKRYDKEEYYFCNSYIKNKEQSNDYIRFIINLYVMIVATYGTIILSNNYLLGQLTAGSESIFIGSPIIYGMLSLILGSDDKNKLKGFSLFIYYLIYIIKVMVLIELLLIWFI